MLSSRLTANSNYWRFKMKIKHIIENLQRYDQEEYVNECSILGICYLLSPNLIEIDNQSILCLSASKTKQLQALYKRIATELKYRKVKY